ncbi:hydrolase [uncultured Flavonifractor sp.]|uniref:hydrolase n=1 Tax=uncultured Flavonifractor sp. TaxID=1193534 RepID=UPI002632A191|nr:hydrolase [uncultured Flavonifractor sp.]
MTQLTREQAVALLKEYNQESFHLRHAFTVEAVMDWYARELGYGDQADFWAMAGLLHDLDFERYPDQHCVKVREIMEARDLDPALVHAVVSHGWGMTGGNVPPEHEMEKVLFAADELTGLIGAAALMRPSRSVQDMELSSLKKKYKDKRFAAGCSRETIAQGAQLLGWELSDLLERTLQAMKAREADIEAQCAGL